MKKISIIIPIYNVEKYVAECLESILNQDFDDYEVICVDDASTDSSMEIVEKYASQNEKIKIINHEKNKGLSAARNTGLKYAKGKYIWFVDSDDMVEQSALKCLYDIVESNNLDVLFFNYKNIYEEEMNFLQDSTKEKEMNFTRVYTGQELFCLFCENNIIKVESWRQFYKREFLLENGIRFYDGILHEDTLFTFICAMSAKRVMDINKQFYIYRRRPQSIVNTMSVERLQSYYIILIEIFKIWNFNTYTERVHEAISFYFKFLFMRYKKIKSHFDKNDTLGQETEAEKFVKNLLQEKHSPVYVTLSEEHIEIMKDKKIIIYGAGYVAYDVIQLLKMREMTASAVVVTEKSVNAKEICGIKVQGICEYADSVDRLISVLILAATKNNREIMLNTAQKLGFTNIIEPMDIKRNC